MKPYTHETVRALFYLLVFLVHQSVEHLSWIGLFKEDGDQHLAKSPPKPRTPQLSVQEERQHVRRKFLNIR